MGAAPKATAPASLIHPSPVRVLLEKVAENTFRRKSVSPGRTPDSGVCQLPRRFLEQI